MLGQTTQSAFSIHVSGQQFQLAPRRIVFEGVTANANHSYVLHSVPLTIVDSIQRRALPVATLRASSTFLHGVIQSLLATSASSWNFSKKCGEKFCVDSKSSFQSSRFSSFEHVSDTVLGYDKTLSSPSRCVSGSVRMCISVAISVVFNFFRIILCPLFLVFSKSVSVVFKVLFALFFVRFVPTSNFFSRFFQVLIAPSFLILALFFSIFFRVFLSVFTRVPILFGFSAGLFVFWFVHALIITQPRFLCKEGVSC